MSNARIIDRGRGAEIAGTRITVYDILDYMQGGWHHGQIAAFFRLSTSQVLAAIDFIEEHRDEDMKEYREMVERAEAGNPPEIVAKLNAAAPIKYLLPISTRPRIQQRRAPPVSHTWAKLRSAYSLRHRPSRFPLTPRVRRRLFR